MRTSQRGLSLIKSFEGLRSVTAPLNQNQNQGAANLQSSTLLPKLNAGDATAKQFQRWNKADGKVLAGLVRRRAAERDLFLEPM